VIEATYTYTGRREMHKPAARIDRGWHGLIASTPCLARGRMWIADFARGWPLKAVYHGEGGATTRRDLCPEAL